MDAENVLKSEIFRPVVITLVPGIVSIISFLAVANYYHPSLAEQFEKHPIISVSIALAMIIAAGHITEDIGSQIEVFLWGRISNAVDEENWYKYLKSNSLKDTPANSYIADIVLRMKFELGFSVALASFVSGYTWLYFLDVVAFRTYLGALVPVLIVVAYLLFEANCGVKVLMKTRQKILQ